MVGRNIDNLCIARKQLNESFPNVPPLTTKLDITYKKDGVMLFVKSYIPLRRLNDFKIPSVLKIYLLK